jgi:hypothetical protein
MTELRGLICFLDQECSVIFSHLLFSVFFFLIIINMLYDLILTSHLPCYFLETVFAFIFTLMWTKYGSVNKILQEQSCHC